ncbi:hypothetical protein GD1_135 [Paraglaciecola Antarctic GD virus 1]|nr:hypothetical protein GD1_135 [Paraglaciecola Antarctic GD virus 1]
MITVNGKDVDKKHLSDPAVKDHVDQIMSIDARAIEIGLELSRLKISRIVYVNSLAKYINDNPLPDPELNPVDGEIV